MTHKADMLRARGALGRSALGMFALAWLSVATQSCAMAASAEPHCPHCPTEVDINLPPCQSDSGPECAFEDPLTADFRLAAGEVRDTQGKATVSGPSVPPWQHPCVADPPLYPSSVFLDPGGPSLQALYCVYLK